MTNNFTLDLRSFFFPTNETSFKCLENYFPPRHPFSVSVSSGHKESPEGGLVDFLPVFLVSLPTTRRTLRISFLRDTMGTQNSGDKRKRLPHTTSLMESITRSKLILTFT